MQSSDFLSVKDSKGLAEFLKEQRLAPDEMLVSFDVSALFNQHSRTSRPCGNQQRICETHR